MSFSSIPILESKLTHFDVVVDEIRFYLEKVKINLH